MLQCFECQGDMKPLCVSSDDEKVNINYCCPKCKKMAIVQWYIKKCDKPKHVTGYNTCQVRIEGEYICVI